LKLLALTADDLSQALSMKEAIDGVKDAFSRLSAGRASTPPRTAVDVRRSGGTTLLMGAQVDGLGLATKTVSVFPRNRELGQPVVHGLVLVLDPDTGEPQALCDGTFLTALRTGAASGAATELLSRTDARVGAVIGCGAQGRTQALAIDCVRRLEEIRLCDRQIEVASRMADDLRDEVDARLVVLADPSGAVADADVICAATTSATPVFDGKLLKPGAHVNGVGSFTLEMRELDGVTVSRSRVFVDSMETALAEAGDLVSAENEGLTTRDGWVELGLVAAGRAPGRGGTSEITLFKSVGHAVQDVATAALALASARERGLGRLVEL
jgi:ornithine cyclodeaminase